MLAVAPDRGLWLGFVGDGDCCVGGWWQLVGGDCDCCVSGWWQLLTMFQLSVVS